MSLPRGGGGLVGSTAPPGFGYIPINCLLLWLKLEKVFYFLPLGVQYPTCKNRASCLFHQHASSAASKIAALGTSIGGRLGPLTPRFHYNITESSRATECRKDQFIRVLPT